MKERYCECLHAYNLDGNNRCLDCGYFFAGTNPQAPAPSPEQEADDFASREFRHDNPGYNGAVAGFLAGLRRGEERAAAQLEDRVLLKRKVVSIEAQLTALQEERERLETLLLKSQDAITNFDWEGMLGGSTYYFKERHLQLMVDTLDELDIAVERIHARAALAPGGSKE